MPGGGVVASGTSDVNRIEAPVTVKAYLTCVFAAFGGILYVICDTLFLLPLTLFP